MTGISNNPWTTPPSRELCSENSTIHLKYTDILQYQWSKKLHKHNREHYSDFINVSNFEQEHKMQIVIHWVILQFRSQYHSSWNVSWLMICKQGSRQLSSWFWANHQPFIWHNCPPYYTKDLLNTYCWCQQQQNALGTLLSEGLLRL